MRAYIKIKKTKARSKLNFLCSIFSLFISINTHGHKLEDEKITVMVGGFSPAMQAYHRQVITKILHFSEEKYGKLNIEYFDKDLSPKRGYKETSEGRIVQLGFSTERPENYQDDVDFSIIRIPIYNGIHGLRKMVVRADDFERFSQLQSAKQFSSLQVGQGTHWPDNKIFEGAGVTVKEAVRFPNLFSMLDQHRFDYISLGILEIEQALAIEENFRESLTIHDRTFIYYALPVSLNIANNRKNLKERILYGKDRFIESGSLDRVFREHFGKIVKKIPRHDAKVFVLHNPNLSDEENIHSINKALGYYFANTSSIYNLTELNIK